MDLTNSCNVLCRLEFALSGRPGRAQDVLIGFRPRDIWRRPASSPGFSGRPGRRSRASGSTSPRYSNWTTMASFLCVTRRSIVAVGFKWTRFCRENSSGTLWPRSWLFRPCVAGWIQWRSKWRWPTALIGGRLHFWKSPFANRFSDGVTNALNHQLDNATCRSLASIIREGLSKTHSKKGRLKWRR